MIRGIIFDCFGVLYGGSLGLLLELCPPERINELRDLNKQSDYGYISSDDYFQGIATILDRPVEDIYEIMRQRHIRNQELVAYARTLRPDYKVGLLSNVSSDVIEQLFTPDELTTLFDATVLSYKEHMTKPHPMIYELMAERLGLSTGECIMIDDLVGNCEGAEVAGMQSIQYVSNQYTIEELSKKLQQ